MDLSIIQIRERNIRSHWLLMFAVFLCLLLPSPGVTGVSRIVSLLPSNTEILESLGVGSAIVGVTIFDRDEPGRARVGDLVHPHMEKIVSLKPDLVVAGQWKDSRVVPRLRSMGYRVIEVPNPDSLEALYASITQVAKEIERPNA